MTRTEMDMRQQQRVIKELRAVGVTTYGLMHTEAHELHKILHHDEHINGVVYGRNDDGFAMLVATDRRALYIDKKPFFMKSVEINYDLVGGASYSRAGLAATVTLHTRIGDYKLRTLNLACAKQFLNFIELHCLEHEQKQAGTLAAAHPTTW